MSGADNRNAQERPLGALAIASATPEIVVIEFTSVGGAG